jgi:energy-coupling factor transport system permease protein
MQLSVHPVIRVACLIVFAIVVTRVSLWHMLPAILVLGLAYFRYLQVPARKRALTILYRMRWFFASLLFVYGWLSPDPVTGQVSIWGWPSQSGLYAGCRQLLALALIMLAVNLLLVCSRRQELVQAIYWLARPLSWFGLSRERLAVRLVLVLDKAVDVRERVGREMADHRTEIHQTRLRWRLASLAHMAATLIDRTLKRIEASTDQELTFTPVSAPPWYQWGLPAAVIPLLLLPY